MSGLPLERPSRPTTVELDDRDGLEPTAHVFMPDHVDAVNLALLSRRPLLLRGEPGTGKSQLARAVAQKLGRALLWKTVDAQTLATDLLYSVDPVARLARAQLLGVLGKQDDDVKARLALERFLAPGPLWWAFDWTQAKEQAEKAQQEVQVERWDQLQDGSRGCVVLIDEIDKADSAVPNGLLEALGSHAFAVPGRADKVRAADPTNLLIMVTTNEERALPDAFLRRCIVLHLELPAERKPLLEQLQLRGAAHFPGLSRELQLLAAERVADEREAVRDGLVPPGQAEYLDLLRAMNELMVAGSSRDEIEKLFKLMADYALKKHPRRQERAAR